MLLIFDSFVDQIILREREKERSVFITQLNIHTYFFRFKEDMSSVVNSAHAS